ncbi:hypothetical protein ACJMK2_035947, partial [Sinanodonta woodiana]
ERDLVGSSQDGAAVNKKCLCHIHQTVLLEPCFDLGVCDTLYKQSTEMDDLNLDSNDIDEM